MDEVNRLQELLARVLAAATAEQLREIVAEVVRRHMDSHDCQAVLKAAVEPIVREVAKAVVQEPAVLEQLQARVKSELFRLVGQLKVDVRGY